MYIFIPYARNIVFWKNKHQAPKVVKMRQDYTKVENSKNILNSFFLFCQNKGYDYGLLLHDDIRP